MERGGTEPSETRTHRLCGTGGVGGTLRRTDRVGKGSVVVSVEGVDEVQREVFSGGTCPKRTSEKNFNIMNIGLREETK